MVREEQLTILFIKPEQNHGYWVKVVGGSVLTLKAQKRSLPVQPPMCFPPGHGKGKKILQQSLEKCSLSFFLHDFL